MENTSKRPLQQVTAEQSRVTAGVAYTGSYNYIHQEGVTTNVNVYPVAEESQNPGLKDDGAEGFLETMKKYVSELTKNSSISTFDNLNEMDPKILPSMGVVDLTKGNEVNIFQESGDIKDSRDTMDVVMSNIKLSQLHDPYKGQNPKRVFLLGDVGGGKTLASKLYARMVLNGEIKGFKHIQLVHFISISDLQQITTTAFDLLVSRQVGLDEKTEFCGEKWLAKNASKTLFVLDGLDQSAEDLSGQFPKVAKLQAPASTREILLNILSGTLYPGLTILVTSRQNAFWNLDYRLRSSKTVVLRGFDHPNLQNVTNALAGGNKGDTIIAAIRKSSLLSLCRTPVFLIYAIEVFKENMNNPPNTMTALMSAVLKLFEGSPNWNDDFESLTKLAYHATIENRYKFTEKYVRRIGIVLPKLGGILKIHTRLLRSQLNPGTGDKNWSFPHQSLQEFLGALGIFDEGQDKFDQLVENELNTAKLEIVRKFVYGMVLNPATRNLCESYLKDKSVSLEACKKTLMKQLDKLLAKDVIDDIKVISLLHECGPDVISHYTSRINRISINEEFLKPEDEHSLMLISNQCVSMKEVRIQHMEMNPFCMEQICGFIDKVENFEICTMTVGKHIMTEHCRELTDLVPKIKINQIHMGTTDNIASTLLQTWIDDKQAPCKELVLIEQFSIDILPKTGQFLSEFGADSLGFGGCRITKEKLEVLCDSMEKGAKIQEFQLSDKEMDNAAYHGLARAVGKAQTRILLLDACNITEKKLEAFGESAKENNVEFKLLAIGNNEDLNDDCYNEIIEICKNANANLQLINCNASNDQVSKLRMHISNVIVEQ